jgi:hypothetical protein
VARLGSVTFLVTHPHAGHPSGATHFNVNVFQRLRLFSLDWKPLIRLRREPRSIKVTEFEHRQITAVRKELDQEYEAQVGLKTQLSKDAAPVKISSNLRLDPSCGSFTEQEDNAMIDLRVKRLNLSQQEKLLYQLLNDKWEKKLTCERHLIFSHRERLAPP